MKRFIQIIWIAGCAWMLQSLTVQAQYPVRIRVNGMPNKRAFLLEYSGIKTHVIDSAQVQLPGGLITFVLPPSAHPGMYRVVVGPNTYWDFIFNREPVELQTSYHSVLDSLKVICSDENRLLKRYMDHAVILKRKNDALQQLLHLYEPGDPFYRQVLNELQKISSANPDQVTRELISKYPGSFTARFLKTEMNPPVPVEIPKDRELKYLLDHFFDLVDFTDTAQLYAPALMGKVRTFFRMIPQAYPPDQVEETMKKGLDRLMSLAAVNDVLFHAILEDIAEWAERSEYETFFAYLTEFYLTESDCKDPEKAKEWKDLLESIQKTKVGKQAPEIILPQPDQKTILLSELNARYKLVVFWASWCPHCAEMMPGLKKLYERYHGKDFEIVAISVDESRKEWQQAIQQGGYSWINYSELKGWDSPIAYDYGIRATPTMILMDHNLKILAKPRNVSMLETKLKELGVHSVH